MEVLFVDSTKPTRIDKRLGTSTRVTCEVQITFTQGGSVRERRAMSDRLLASNGGCRDLRWLNRLSK